jgi:signal transduction histidine kinase
MADQMSQRPPSRRAIAAYQAGRTDDDQAGAAAKLFTWCEQLVGIDGAVIHMASESGLQVTWVAEGRAMPADAQVIERTNPGPVARAFRHAVTQVVASEVDLTAATIASFGWKSALCVPLMMEDRVIGVFTAGWRSPVPVSKDAQLVLEAAASMTGAVLNRLGLVQDLKREQQRLRSVLEGLPIAASILDIPGLRVRWRNVRAQRLFGDVNRSDALERTFGLHAGPTEIGTMTSADYIQSILLEDATPGWTVTDASSGQQRVLAPTIARLDSESLVVIHTDVTREVHIDQERSRFVHMFSHHLRTPLTPLLGYARLLAEPGLDDTTRTEAVRQIDLAVVEITALVSRLEQIAALKPVDPQSMGRHLISDLIEEAWGRLGKHHQTEIHMEGSAAIAVLCSRDHVVEALGEIFANAVTHGKPPVLVRISTGGDARIRISDAGEGIPAEWEDAIFAPFVSAKSGYLAPVAGHAGLGLNLARGLILATGGTLTYADGQFTVRLPVAAK